MKSLALPVQTIVCIFTSPIAGFVSPNAIISGHSYRSFGVPSSSLRDAAFDDMENTRKELEEMFQDEGLHDQIFRPQVPNNYNNNNNNCEHYPPTANQLTTSVALRRLEVEIGLLESLLDSDDAIDKLVHLWVTERDSESAEDLFRMEQGCTPGLVAEELALRNILQRHEGWVEPLVRLATLLYYKGRTDDAYYLALHAIYLKPWHIEVPHLLLLIALRNQDAKQTLYWARRRLPPITAKNKRRRAWVEKALEKARGQLVEAQRKHQELSGQGFTGENAFQ